VFLHAWEAIGGFRWQGRPFVAWLYRLAHNAHVDQIRRQRPTLSFDDEADLPQLESTTGGASDVIEKVDAQVVSLAVRHLTPKQRQVIYLRFTADLDTSAIAEIMGEREGAIRALQLRALLSLRRVLDTQAAFEDRQGFSHKRAPGG
jgi:RNA polymerase sigma-70 factor (ECF subfamily)